MQNNNFQTIDEYLEMFSGDLKEKLIQFRNVVKNSAPQATEAIKYRMPTFCLNGNLVHFAAFKNHIGFFPTPSGITPFKKELEGYVTSKGTIQFPKDKPLPLDLIRKIVEYRVKENLNKK